jgi:hypothetical protein
MCIALHLSDKRTNNLKNMDIPGFRCERETIVIVICEYSGIYM